MHIPDTFAQANLVFLWPVSGQRAEIAFGMNLSGYSNGPTQAAADVFTAFSDADWASIMTSTLELETVKVKFGPNDTGASGEFNAAAPGTLSGGGLTPNVAVLVRKVTGTGGRHGRGRMFLPGWQEGTVDAYGNLEDDARDLIQNIMTDFLNNLASQNLSMELLHTGSSPAPSPVETLIVESKVATQRRRLRP